MNNSNEVIEQINDLKKSNSRNNKIIVILLIVLFFVSAVAVYVRFFS